MLMTNTCARTERSSLDSLLSKMSLKIAAIWRTRAKRFLDMNKLLTDNLDKLRELCIRYKVSSLYVFGSINSTSFNDESDIDFLVDFIPGISIEEYTDFYFMLRKELELLFDRRIDLVTKRSLSNPYFIESFERTKRLIYTTDIKSSKVIK